MFYSTRRPTADMADVVQAGCDSASPLLDPPTVAGVLVALVAVCSGSLDGLSEGLPMLHTCMLLGFGYTLWVTCDQVAPGATCALVGGVELPHLSVPCPSVAATTPHLDNMVFCPRLLPLAVLTLCLAQRTI